MNKLKSIIIDILVLLFILMIIHSLCEVNIDNKTETENSSEVTVEVATLFTEDMVWIPTKGGEKYHCMAECSQMVGLVQIAESEAIEVGFEPCGRCY